MCLLKMVPSATCVLRDRLMVFTTGGPAYYVLHPQKGITIFFFYLTRPSKAGKESFLRQILLSDLRLDTYEWRQTKI